MSFSRWYAVLAVVIGFGFSGVSQASHVPLSPGDMPAWDADLLFIDYGSNFGFNNDSVANVEAMLAASGVNTGPDSGLFQIGKILGSSDFTFTPADPLAASSGTWTYIGSGFEIQYLVIKGGSNEQFALYELKGSHDGTTGPWNTENISAGGPHNVPNVSHLSFYGSKVPEPSALAALAGLAVMGCCAAMWKRRR